MSLSFYGKRPGPGMRLDKLSRELGVPTRFTNSSPLTPGACHSREVGGIRTRLAAEDYVTGDGFKFQISVAYSRIVRSLENVPEHATLMMAFLTHLSGSA
jgi:hypothetical protein